MTSNKQQQQRENLKENSVADKVKLKFSVQGCTLFTEPYGIPSRS